MLFLQFREDASMNLIKESDEGLVPPGSHAIVCGSAKTGAASMQNFIIFCRRDIFPTAYGATSRKSLPLITLGR